MHRAALVVADGEQGLADHRAQGGLGQGEGVLLVHGGQLGELLRVAAHNIELGQAALDVDHIALGGEDHHVVGHLADDLAEEPGGQDQRAPLGDLGGDGGLDARLQIIAGETQLAARLDEDALHGRNGTFCGHRPGCHGYRGGEQGLLAGEFHWDASSFFLSATRGEDRIILVTIAVEKKSVENREKPLGDGTLTVHRGCGQKIGLIHRRRNGKKFSTSVHEQSTSKCG